MNDSIKSILAGICIGIAGTVYLALGGGPIAAILFSIGLIIIVLQEYNLYTGKIGYIKSYKEIPKMLLMILGNFIGCLLVGLTCNQDASTLVQVKLQIPLWLVLFKAIWCGFLMYSAVNIYKEHKNLFGILFCVPVFILAGFEHSIADMYYFITANSYNTDSLIFIIIVLIGNAIGANLHLRIKNKKYLKF